jgi:hypothetical protein
MSDDSLRHYVDDYFERLGALMENVSRDAVEVMGETLYRA